MLIATLFLIFPIIVHYGGSIVVIDAGKELKAVAVLYRHGDRAPIGSYPNDPYFNLTYWPQGFGQLLKAGEKRQYDLGSYLRFRYSNFLSENYVKDEIYVRSSDIDRTLMSASSNLAGLYPLKKDDIFGGQVKWQPIPIHTVPKNEDAIVAMFRECPKYDKLYNEESKNQYKTWKNNHTDYFNQLSNFTSWSTDEIDFQLLYTTFYVYRMHNESFLPSWYSLIENDIFRDLAGKTFSGQTTPTLKRLGSGPFFNYMLTHFENVLNNTASKFLMLSGHDTTIAAILNAMGVYENEPPEFASMVIWELFKETDDSYSIKVSYKKNSESDPKPLIFEDCESPCSYDLFKEKIVGSLSIDEDTWLSECNSDDSGGIKISAPYIFFTVMLALGITSSLI